MQAPKLLFASFAVASLCLTAPATPIQVPEPPALPTEELVEELEALETLVQAAPSAFAQVPADMLALLPGDLTAFVLTKPIAELEGVALSLAEEIMPEMAAMMNADQMLAQFGLDPTTIDHTKPIAFGMGPVSTEREPDLYVLVPTKDSEGLQTALAAMADMPPTAIQAKVVGNYVGLTLGPAYPEAGLSPLLQSVPKGLLGVAIDVEAIIDTLGPAIEMGLQFARMAADDEMPEDLPMDMGGMLDFYFGMAEGAIDSIEQLRFSIDVTDSLLDIRNVIAVSEGSPMSDLASDTQTDLSKLLPLMGEGSMGLVMGADLTDLMGKFQPIINQTLDMYPEEMREGLVASMQVYEDVFGLLGPGMVASGGFAEGGLQGSVFFDGANFEDFLTAYEDAIHMPFMEQLGMEYLGTKTGRSGDIAITRFTFDYNMDMMVTAMGEEISEGDLAEIEQLITAIYGEQLVVTLAKSHGIGVMVLGAEDTLMTDALGRIATGGSINDELAPLQAIAERCNPFINYSIDIGELMATLMAVLEGQMGGSGMGMDTFEGVNLPLNVYFGATRTEWTAGLMVDLIQISEFAQMVSFMDEMAEM